MADVARSYYECMFYFKFAIEYQCHNYHSGRFLFLKVSRFTTVARVYFVVLEHAYRMFAVKSAVGVHAATRPLARTIKKLWRNMALVVNTFTHARVCMTEINKL